MKVMRIHNQHTCTVCVCVCVLVAQSCPNLCNPMNYSPPGSSVHGILQARILEWVTIPFSGDFPNPGIKPGSPEFQADSLPFEPPGKPSCTVRNGKGGLWCG